MWQKSCRSPCDNTHMTEGGNKRARADSYAHALTSLRDAFDEGFHRAKQELVAGTAQPLRDARNTFQIQVSRLDILDGRCDVHVRRFRQFGRVAALAAGPNGRATLAPDPANRAELIGPSQLTWTVSFDSSPRPSRRNVLTYEPDGMWLVTLGIRPGETMEYRGNSPASAIARAADDVVSGTCTACAGTGVSRDWPGQGRAPQCASCEGKRKAGS